ncbi:NRPE1 [Symbiodinium sp. CCMP2592]|nr:NRPE1 [Symbiodinium sp. CCMP2592]
MDHTTTFTTHLAKTHSAQHRYALHSSTCCVKVACLSVSLRNMMRNLAATFRPAIRIRQSWRQHIPGRWVQLRPLSSLPSGWQEYYSEKYARPYYWHQATGTSQWHLPEVAQADSEKSTQSSESVAKGQGRASEDVTEMPQTVRDSQWKVVWSEEYGRNYYWHVPSGRTAWERPSDMPTDADSQRLKHVMAASRDILHGATVGEDIPSGDDLQVVKDLLNYHPDAKRKIGGGLRSIKVDFAPPPNHKHRCFWVVRVDGSQEDFSARKCRDAIRRELHAARHRVPAE